MGYSPQDCKESDMTERLPFLPPFLPSFLPFLLSFFQRGWWEICVVDPSK